jgi:hypothetical protein
MLIFLRSQREFCEGFFRTAGRPRISRLNAQQSQPSGSTLPQCSPDRSRPLAIYSTQRAVGMALVRALSAHSR